MADSISAKIKLKRGGNYLNCFVDKSFSIRGGWWRSMHASWFKEANQSR